MARPSFLRLLIALRPFESIFSRASIYFWTERLQRVFTFFVSMYMGMCPFDSPRYILFYFSTAELAEEIWYPKGGFHTTIAESVNDSILNTVYQSPCQESCLTIDLVRVIPGLIGVMRKGVCPWLDRSNEEGGISLAW